MLSVTLRPTEYGNQEIKSHSWETLLSHAHHSPGFETYSPFITEKMDGGVFDI